MYDNDAAATRLHQLVEDRWEGTRKSLAEEVGTTAPTLSRMTGGEVNLMLSQYVARLARVLQSSEEWILFGELGGGIDPAGVRRSLHKAEELAAELREMLGEDPLIAPASPVEIDDFPGRVAYLFHLAEMPDEPGENPFATEEHLRWGDGEPFYGPRVALKAEMVMRVQNSVSPIELSYWELYKWVTRNRIPWGELDPAGVDPVELGEIFGWMEGDLRKGQPEDDT